jgi:hypothetical protein
MSARRRVKEKTVLLESARPLNDPEMLRPQTVRNHGRADFRTNQKNFIKFGGSVPQS